MKARLVRPEILDRIGPRHRWWAPMRRDLRRFNQLMGTRPWFARQLRRHARPGEGVIELGAGDGWLLRGLAAAHHGRHAWSGLDRQPRPDDLPASIAWQQADAQEFAPWPPVVLVNLLLHQLSDAALAALGAAWDEAARVVIVQEPLRAGHARWALRATYPLGLHPATRYDAHISIGAGFRGGELPARLGWTRPRWEWRVDEGWRGQYRLVAWRREEEASPR